MKKITEFKDCPKFVLTDIDDTLTKDGRLEPEAYSALWDLARAKVAVVAVTGRPAGWCELIARQWPVAGVVGENGAFSFYYAGGKMHRHFNQNQELREKNHQQLRQIAQQVLQTIPGTAIASDQFCRVSDVAIDFCEDVPRLPEDHVQKIKTIFEQAGATAKISSIHVNAWFGSYDKKSESLWLLTNILGCESDSILQHTAYIGDSPNDEPMWQWLPLSVGVQNVQAYLPQLRFPPRYMTTQGGGQGFAEFAHQILRNLANRSAK